MSRARKRGPGQSSCPLIVYAACFVPMSFSGLSTIRLTNSKQEKPTLTLYMMAMVLVTLVSVYLAAETWQEDLLDD